MIIAIDFDGTIVDDSGIEIQGALDVIRLLHKRHSLILWTCRGGDLLDEAVKWLENRAIIFDKVNENLYPLTSRGKEYYPRKVFAHYYIDDRIIGGIMDWKIIREILEKEGVL